MNGKKNVWRNNSTEISKIFGEIIEIILIKKYRVENIRELIYATHLLHRLNPNLDHITLRLIKTRVSRNIYNEIKYIRNISIFIEQLIKLEKHYIRKTGFRHFNYRYIKDNE